MPDVTHAAAEPASASPGASGALDGAASPSLAPTAAHSLAPGAAAPPSDPTDPAAAAPKPTGAPRKAPRLDATPLAERKANFINHFVAMYAGVPLVDLAGRIDLAAVAGQVWDGVEGVTAASAETMASLDTDHRGYDLVTTKDAAGNVTGADARFEKALAIAKPFADTLKSYVKSSQQAVELAAKGFAFWSGSPAKEAAKASGLQSLEGSQLGGIFEGKHILPDGVNMAIWGSISKAYAEWATEDMEGRAYKGYVGLGGDAKDNIYNSVEQWVVKDAVKLAKDAGKSVPDFEWFAVTPPESEYVAAGKEARDLKSFIYEKGGSDVGGPFKTREEAVSTMLRVGAERKHKMVLPQFDPLS
jgi:hypothetical protein